MNEGAVQALERAILELLEARDWTICPSEAARAIGGQDWRGLMEATCEAGRRLAGFGQIVVLQSGRPVDPKSATGPIRYGSVRR